jgi:hypothetical protein
VERRIFAIEVPARNAEVLEEIIDEYVRMGQLYTQTVGEATVSWIKKNLQHKTVNHSRTFKDLVTGVHTNTLEVLMVRFIEQFR